MAQIVDGKYQLENGLIKNRKKPFLIKYKSLFKSLVWLFEGKNYIFLFQNIS